MELTLTDDQAFFRDTTERFLATECPVSRVRALADSDDGFDRAYWTQGAALGWTSLLVPDTDGGGRISDAGLVDATLVADAFGRHLSPGPLIPVNVVASAIARSGSDDQRGLYLPGLLSGDEIAAWCGAPYVWAGAPTPGLEASTSAGCSITAEPVGDGIVLRGRSEPVEAAGQADVVLVTALSNGGLVHVLVPRGTDGISVAPLTGVDIVRRFARVEFDSVSVPATAFLGPTSTAVENAEQNLQVALALQAAEMVGAAQRVFDFTLVWAFDRYSFGRPLASYQELKHRFADMKLWLETSHALTSALAREAVSAAPGAAETASMTKAYLGEYLPRLAQDCVQMHGGIGLTAEHDIHLYLRRLTASRATYGTPADHRRRIGKVAA